MYPRMRRFFVVALLLSSVLPGFANAVTLENGQTCPVGTRLVTFEEAWNNSSAYCGLLGTWTIARLSGNASMDGPGYGCGVRSSDSRGLGQALCQPVATERSLTSVILSAGWRTASQLATMSEGDKRNTVVIELHLASTESIAALQAKSDSQLIGYVEIYLWLLESHSRSAAQLAQMSLGDQRNTIVVELHVRTAEPVAVLSGLGDLGLTAMARSLPKILLQTGPTCPAGTSLVGFGEAKDNTITYCSMLGSLDIVRLSGNGSMDGPGYGCGVRSSDSRNLSSALCRSSSEISSLTAVILEAGWRTPSELAAMTEIEKRNTVNIELELASSEGLAAIQAKSNDELVGHVEIYLWLLRSNFRTAGQLAQMSLGDQRNAAVAELGTRTGETASVLSALDNRSLIEMARFYAANPPGFWMAENIALLGNRPLRHLCMPGSHDAGMSEFNASTAFANAGNTKTQTLGILQQLRKGVRYFDVRPVISGGQFHTGHYGEIEIGFEVPIFGGYVSLGTSFQGANGQSIASVIQDVNTFTASRPPGQPGELVVLYLSHDLNTDVGNSSYRPFVQQEWNSLLSQLQGINFLYEETNPYVDLTQVPLANFTRNGSAVVVIVDSSPQISLGALAGEGFFKASNFPVYNAYSDSDSLNSMKNDQLAKLQQHRPNPDASFFLLSWTLTQQGLGAISGPSILSLANGANPAIYSTLLPACTQQTYPNILYIDGIDSANITALAMAVNIKAIGHF